MKRSPTTALLLLLLSSPAHAGMYDTLKDGARTMRDTVSSGMRHGANRNRDEGRKLTKHDTNRGPARDDGLKGDRFWRCHACKQMAKAIGNSLDFNVERSTEKINEIVSDVCEDLEDYWTSWKQGTKLGADEKHLLNVHCVKIASGESKRRMVRRYSEIARVFGEEFDVGEKKGRMAFSPYAKDYESEVCTYVVPKSCATAEELTDLQFAEAERQGVQPITMDTASGKQVMSDGSLQEFPVDDEELALRAQEEEEERKHAEEVMRRKQERKAAKAAAKAKKASEKADL